MGGTDTQGTDTKGTDMSSPDDIFSPSGTLQTAPWTKLTMSTRMKRRLRTLANENYLFHGTDRQSAEAIIKEDFNIKMAGSAHAKILGRGAYFAECASLADKYAPPGPDGLHQLLLVRCALGRVFVTKRYTGWRGHKLVRMVSTTKLVRRGAY